MSGVQWAAYYLRMVPWLYHGDAQIRASAVERLAMAVLRAEYAMPYRGGPASGPSTVPAADRLAWLLNELHTAHGAHSDVLPAFLSDLRFHGDDEPFRLPLLSWLDAIARQRPEGVDAGVIEGTKLLLSGAGDDALNATLSKWIGLLDHKSDYVRGCAARQLGAFSQADTIPSTNALFDLIGAKEIQRPGIAGPFWPYSFDDSKLIKSALWMLDLLERRHGSAPLNMPFNDIEFHLHELCCASPDWMQRMLRGGFVELALETATEIRGRVDGVQPILEKLATDGNLTIAARAEGHLTAYYRSPDRS